MSSSSCSSDHLLPSDLAGGLSKSLGGPGGEDGSVGEGGREGGGVGCLSGGLPLLFLLEEGQGGVFDGEGTETEHVCDFLFFCCCCCCFVSGKAASAGQACGRGGCGDLCGCCCCCCCCCCCFFFLFFFFV